MQTEPEKERIGLIGLGLMGTALTERLLEHGYRVAVWNRTRDKADPLLARGAEWSDNPLAVCDRVLISLYTSDVVEEVIEQLQAGLRPGQIIIDTTTGEPGQTAALGGAAGGPRRALSRCADLGLERTDAAGRGDSDRGGRS